MFNIASDFKMRKKKIIYSHQFIFKDHFFILYLHHMVSISHTNPDFSPEVVCLISSHHILLKQFSLPLYQTSLTCGADNHLHLARLIPPQCRGTNGAFHCVCCCRLRSELFKILIQVWNFSIHKGDFEVNIEELYLSVCCLS